MIVFYQDKKEKSKLKMDTYLSFSKINFLKIYSIEFKWTFSMTLYFNKHYLDADIFCKSDNSLEQKCCITKYFFHQLLF